MSKSTKMELIDDLDAYAIVQPSPTKGPKRYKVYKRGGERGIMYQDKFVPLKHMRYRGPKLSHCCIELEAPNDVNGNPRHVVLIYDLQGQLLTAEDLGYRSWRQACEELGYGRPILLGTFPTTVEHYNYLTKE